MKINIFGSTGNIGTKSLYLLQKYYSNIKINLLVANKNYKKLILQTNYYKPKYICINDNSKIKFIKKNINKYTKIIKKEDLDKFIKNSKSDLTILAISGYESLKFLETILFNTYNLGLVSKECIVSSGHLLKRLSKKNKVNIYPLDSEHFSLIDFFKLNKNKSYKNIFLTASGGPFLYKELSKINKATFNEAINHPKWKMGYKNSIDSATLSNKCLEIIEAHYLFNIPFDKIKILIHPEALIHSVIEMNNFTTQMNYFYHDMSIPLLNFLNTSNNQEINYEINKFNFTNKKQLTFDNIDLRRYPVYKIFLKLNKTRPSELIKFNIANEFAVELFKKNIIEFGDIYKVIDKSLSLELNNSINSIEKIIEYQINYRKKISLFYE